MSIPRRDYNQTNRRRNRKKLVHIYCIYLYIFSIEIMMIHPQTKLMNMDRSGHSMMMMMIHVQTTIDTIVNKKISLPYTHTHTHYIVMYKKMIIITCHHHQHFFSFHLFLFNSFFSHILYQRFK